MTSGKMEAFASRLKKYNLQLFRINAHARYHAVRIPPFSVLEIADLYIRNKKPIRTAEFLGNEDPDKERIKTVCPGEREE